MMVSPADELALFERLVRIETKLDGFNGTVAEHGERIRSLEQDNMPGGHADHESRIRRLEKSLWIAVGCAAAGGGAVGTFLAPLVH